MKPLSAWFATWHYKPTQPLERDDSKVVVPAVACGRRYRQLRWKEPMLPDDEFFGGTRERPRWVVMGESGRQYRPQTANSLYAPWAIVRRKLP